MSKSRDCRLLSGLLVALLVGPPPLPAAVIVVGGPCTLVDAITAANTDSPTGGCPAGSGADEIELTIDVTLTSVDNDTDGPNGLPSITSEMTIRSSDASPRTVERAVGAPLFRIFHAGAGGDLRLERVLVTNGESDGSGGGIFNRAQLALANSTVSGNSSSGIYGGGGIYNTASGTVEMTQSTMSGNAAIYGGGGIENNYGTLRASRSTFSGNSARSGGGIRTSGIVALTNSTVSGNSASVYGGGIEIYFGTLSVTGSTISNNSANYGGGIYNVFYGTTILTNSTVSGNTAANRGGGIYNGYNVEVSLTNSTVSGNSATFGGGIYNYYGILNVNHSTLSGNSASYGGGIHNLQGTPLFTGSLVGHSQSGGNCAGTPILDNGSNLADDTTCGTIPDTLSGLDPGLADNGGPTLTHALLAGSNAIDLAGDCGLATDQRLAPRTDGSCDSGSFEFGADPGLVFTDGFESGDTSAWSLQVP